MEKEDLSGKICEYLTPASQLADIEGAQGTARLLASMQRLIRYAALRSGWVPLTDEWAALKDLIEIRKGRFGNRIHLGTMPQAALFVPRMALVNAAEEACAPDEMLRDPAREFEIEAQVHQDMALGYQLRLTVHRAGTRGDADFMRQWTL